MTAHHRVRETITAYGLLAPALAVFSAFAFYPLWRIIWLGLHEQNRQGKRQRWVGPSQYQEVLTGEEFRGGVGVARGGLGDRQLDRGDRGDLLRAARAQHRLPE